ncbi:MAG: calcium/sodium antiporter, partial [Gammaproteobacteria bacterium]
MLVDILAVLAGFGLLIWSADHFVTGASATARNLGVSPLIIGLTIVGFGTSAPEMLVSGFAALDGNPGLSIGNALGSNITNITLILGATALFYPLSVHSGILKREYPLLLTSTILAALFMYHDNELG